MSERRRTAAGRARRRHKAALRTDSGIGVRLITMLIVVAVCLFSVTIFFKVQQIRVQGNDLYDENAVISASGIRLGDPLVTMNKSGIAGRIKAALPYAEQVRISRQLPGTVILEIRESSAIFSVQDDTGAYWLVSFGGRVLEKVTEAAAQTHPLIIGLTLKNPVVGEEARSENTESLRAAKLLTTALEGTGIAKEATKLDVTKPYDIILWYKDQYDVRFGGTDQLAYKVQYLVAVLDQLAEYQTGTIDLTFEAEKVARFIPW
ncbi:MAG: FtsQ-type POTRA domain-containing protein [Oscillospiraceae bacterium]|nr:FtsQ-type POTRA domain-containing protein [Oscillospiraceae bacterium]